MDKLSVSTHGLTLTFTTQLLHFHKLDRLEVSHEMNDQAQFEVGEKVEARYKGKSKRYYKGEITAVHPDETYDIDYDDGDHERRLSSDFIRKLTAETQPPKEIVVSANLNGEISSESTSSPVSKAIECEPNANAQEGHDDNPLEALSTNPPKFTVGERVEARYKGRASKFYEGIIKAARPDGTFDVDYLDGDRDRRLSGDFIRRLQNHEVEPVKSSNADPMGVKASDANHKIDGSTKPKPSSLSSSSNIVSRDLNSASTQGSATKGFKAGDKIEALFHGRGSRWYKAVVTSRLPNGCFNVQYAAGDRDLNLPPNAVRAVSRRTNDGPKAIDSKTYNEEYVNEVDQKHEDHDADKDNLTSDLVGGADESMKNDAVEDDRTNGCDAITTNEVMDGSKAEEFNPESSSILVNTTSLQNETAAEISMEVGDDKTGDISEGQRKGRISKISIVNVYEITYADGSKDVDVPFEALKFSDGAGGVNIGCCVDVISHKSKGSVDDENNPSKARTGADH
jgi:hypothetical protein